MKKTMCLLTFSLYMLSEHPDIERRLRQEIFDVVGQTGRPRYDQMREMKYMRAFLNGNVFSQFFYLTKTDNLYGRGTKTVSSGVSFSVSLYYFIKPCWRCCPCCCSPVDSRYIYTLKSFCPVSLISKVYQQTSRPTRRKQQFQTDLHPNQYNVSTVQ